MFIDGVIHNSPYLKLDPVHLSNLSHYSLDCSLIWLYFCNQRRHFVSSFWSDADTVCYDEIGCFSNEPPFRDLPDRPISYLPQSRADVGTTFLLNTPSNPSAYDSLSTYDTSTISASNLNPSLPTKVIVHGYTENGYVDWMRLMMEAFLQQGSYNVIRVNWSKGAVGLYGVSTSNTRIVGAEISLLMDKIRVRASTDKQFIDTENGW